MNEKMFNKIIDWTNKEDDIRATIMVGSLAGKNKTDNLSDFDISLFVRSSKKYISNAEWMSSIGNVLVYEPAELIYEDKKYPTRLIIFEDGLKVDFAFYSINVLKNLTKLKKLPLDYNLGYKVLTDKDNLTTKLPKPTYQYPKSRKPNQNEFFLLVNVFFFELYQVAKYLCRNDLWHAKLRDWLTKESLLKIIEWHEKSKHGWDYDTYCHGKKMQSWVSPKVWESLPGAFGHFEKEDGRKALLLSANLFSVLAKSTAKNLGYIYPTETDRKMIKLIKKLH
ncbi:MAG: hypothetical protein COX37_02480 [Candidatus Nealsonbacteria bacterium CG23_combo_of_CG06-09_8_20_14_all_39_17]|uniref:Aminoglycoside adenylyltransferase n=1 Tax=Candidatus Nealsonbacteria bacterium CG23_combo_of_CG06-09_8_20_14_all_39_17 TaxID=1974722 RepID=A0A2G9YVF9_9BACT|nr:MAG: hypothetical protein COX37_02480 [Candidatus Nealsonbacteria bacterium CG23_combo_of_CG06-09_8_20_14_all_39_17]